MAVKPADVAGLADRIARLHLGLPYLAVEQDTRDLIWAVVDARLAQRKSRCGVCRHETHGDPEQAVVLKGRLRFCCSFCFARIERAIMEPPMPDREGV